MAFNTVASLDVVKGRLEDVVAYIDNVAHSPVTEGQSSGAEGSNSVTEEQKSGTKVQKLDWKPDEPKSEWTRKLELGLDSPACYGEADRVLVMKLPDFKRKPEEHYTPQQWRFGLHNRDLQASTTVASTTESEGLKISLAAACNLKPDRRDEVCDNRRDEVCDNRWNKFCDNVVDDPEEMVLTSYGLHPSVATNFSRKEVQSLLTLDALTLLLVLSSWALPYPYSEEELMARFILWLETGGLKIRALLKDGVAYNALRSDLFLFENQIPMALLKNVISKSYLLPKGKNSYSDTFQDLINPDSHLRKKILHEILKKVVYTMCIEIFVEPYADKTQFLKLIHVDYHIGDFEDCAHIFACVYRILTTFRIKKESSTATKDCAHIFACVYEILTTFRIKNESSTATKSDKDETKESASDPEQLRHATSFVDDPTVLDIRETLPIDLEQPGDRELLETQTRIMMKGPDLNKITPKIREEEPDFSELTPRMAIREKEPDSSKRATRMLIREKDLNKITPKIREEEPDFSELTPRMAIREKEPDSSRPATRMLIREKDLNKITPKIREEEPDFSELTPRMAIREKEPDFSELTSRMAIREKCPCFSKPTSKMRIMEKQPDFSILSPRMTIGNQPHSPTSTTSVETEENLGEETLRSATDLKKAGLRIKGVHGMIKEVAFENGCLSLPIVQLNDRTESYFRNLAMYEYFDHYGADRRAFADYLKLMLELIKTPEDVAYLIDDCNVIQNFLVTDKKAFEMWERLQSGLNLPPYSKDYKTKIVIRVNRQCKSTLRQMRTEFYNTFCSKPWLAISVITAVVLLLATLIQTYVSVIGSDKMQPHFPRGG